MCSSDLVGLQLVDERLRLRGPVGRQLAAHAAVEFGSQLRMGGGVPREHVVPRLLRGGALGLVIPAGIDLGRYLERWVLPAQLLARGGDLVLASGAP